MALDLAVYSAGLQGTMAADVVMVVAAAEAWL